MGQGSSHSPKSQGRAKQPSKSKHSTTAYPSRPSVPASSSSHYPQKPSPKPSSDPPPIHPRSHHYKHEDYHREREREAHGYNNSHEHRRREYGGTRSSFPTVPPRTTSVPSYSEGYVERSGPTRQFSLSKPTSSNSPPRASQIEKYFNRYKDEVEDAILAEGMENFCIDLGVDPTEFVVLLVAWKFEASQMCRFTREEFLNGCQKLRAYDAKTLKERLPELVSEVKSSKTFKDLYNFTFTFGLDHSTAQRSLPIDMAIPLWELVFSRNKPAVLDHWFAFLRTTEVRGISRDTWNMFLPFCKTIRPDLSNYDETEAWPSLFDDFVEYETERT